jgi:two-component system chemotaxis response regulator CheY
MEQLVDQIGEYRPVVLVVDDNAAIRDMLSWALELNGYEPAVATEGQEALDWIDNAAREGRYPDVILLDLAMPGMDGDTFLRHLQVRWEAARPFPVIVIVTAHTSGSVKTDVPVQHVIVKPFHVSELVNILHTLMAERLPTQKHP